MIFDPTPLPGVLLVRPERHTDQRGYFARTWDAAVMAEHGLAPALAQCSTSFNPTAGTLRGMHYQEAPHAEAKLVRCVRGSLYDVVVDLRRDSPTFRSWMGVELNPENGAQLYIPEGCAHGYMTIEADTEVSYAISAAWAPAAARGVRWDDPAFGIQWPGTPEVIGERDATYADFAG